MAYTPPRVLVHQEYTPETESISDPRNAHISGGNAELHRYSDSDEKALIGVGEYDPDADTTYDWPDRDAGGLVDQDYVKVFIDDALLLYFTDSIGADSTIAPVSGKPNRVRSSTIGFVDNGDGYERSAELYDRDVKVGDTVYIRGVDGVDTYELWTTVRGFAYEAVAATIDTTPTAADTNAGSQSLSVSVQKLAGVQNCITVTADASGYNGLVEGDVNEVYTIEVTGSSVNGDLTTARLKITSASGNDDNSNVDPAADGDPTDIGARGLTVTFSSGTGSSCSSLADDDEVSPIDLIEGQKWQVTVSQAYTALTATASGTYTGDADDTYIVTVTRGGTLLQEPQVTVTTVKGLDFSGPHTITSSGGNISIGTNGVVIAITGASGFAKDDKFYVDVVAEGDGRASTLILAHSLPEEIQDASDLDLKLYIKQNIEVEQNREGYAPATNWDTEATQITLNSGIVYYHEEWTDGSVELPLEVVGGSVYIEYREWLQDLVDEVNGISGVADIDEIPGALDPDNPLKWAVYKALSNSGGSTVYYTAVADPDDLDSWQDVLDRLKGDDRIYNLVPLTYTKAVWDLYQSHVNSESAAEAGNWQGCIFNLQSRTEKALVDETLTSDEETALATFTDNPDASGSQYTRVTSTNADFVTNGVAAGDELRTNYTTDGFGTETYTSYTIDDVVSENVVILLAGPAAPINVAQKIEVWHNLSKTEIATEMAEKAAAYSDHRVVTVWPDVIASGGVDTDGYYLAAAIAGKISGVVPNQGLTNLVLAGFDNATKSADYFNSTQLNLMAASGVWIVSEDRDGTVLTRHALTTDMSDVNHREEMVRRNVDSISRIFQSRLAPYVGKYNATPGMLDVIEAAIDATVIYLKTNEVTPELGPQLIDATLTQLYIHPLLRDKIVVVLDIEVPAPLNHIELYLVI